MTEAAVTKRLRKHWCSNEKANEPFIKHMVTELEKPERPERKAVVIGAGYGIDEQVALTAAPSVPTCHTFCTDKARPVFAKHGLVPDYTLALNTEETPDVKISQWFANVGEDDCLIMPVTAHPSHMRCWTEQGGGDVFWLIPSNIDTDLSTEWAKKYNSPPIHRGANSGEFAFQMACLLRHSPIALIGMPYAWKSLPEVLKKQTPDSYEYHHFCSDGKHCFTTIGFMQQRTEFLEIVRMHSKVWNGDELIPWIKAYNCSDGGILYDPEVLPKKPLEEFLNDG